MKKYRCVCVVAILFARLAQAMNAPSEDEIIEMDVKTFSSLMLQMAPCHAKHKKSTIQ